MDTGSDTTAQRCYFNALCEGHSDFCSPVCVLCHPSLHVPFLLHIPFALVTVSEVIVMHVLCHR